MIAQEIRKRIKQDYPNLVFTVTKVSFQDLARDSAFVVRVVDWSTLALADRQRLVALIKSAGAIPE